MNRKIKIIIYTIITGVLISGISWAQALEPTKQELESVLSRFINYRFGTVSIYKIKNPSDIKRALRSKSEVGAGRKEAEDLLKTIDPVVASIIQRGVDAGDQQDVIREAIFNSGNTPPKAEIFDKIYQGLKPGSGPTDQVENAYLVTTRADKGTVPNTIIAMITSDRAGDDLEKNLRSRGTADIYTYDEMKQFRLDTSFSATNLYDLMINAIMQGNIENRTLEAQGIGNKEWFSSSVKGNSRSLISKESDITSSDIQKFMRISDGQALDYKIKENELIVSPDLISWRRYELPTYVDNAGNTVADSSLSVNDNLPVFGLELRYGMDNISYPSFWSERVSCSALWQSAKLGLILPTSGWSNLSKDLFDIQRKLTHAGAGITGAFDFPFKVVPKSGVFHFDFDYVFGDAKAASYKTRDLNTDNPAYKADNDYLIRTNLQFHYTFGIAIDADYWFRFGIGTSFYNVEKWDYLLNTDQITGLHSYLYSKLSQESIFGISGKIEFMSKNILTPFGASLQYFDESIGANIWLQIPIVKNTLALRLDAKGYFTAFRDKPHDWENKSVFMPMARFIVNF